MGQKIFYFVVGLSVGGLLLALAERIRPQRGAVYEMPMIKDEKGLKSPSGVYRVTTYNGRAYLMIELPKGACE